MVVAKAPPGQFPNPDGAVTGLVIVVAYRAISDRRTHRAQGRVSTWPLAVVTMVVVDVPVVCVCSSRQRILFDTLQILTEVPIVVVTSCVLVDVIVTVVETAPLIVEVVVVVTVVTGHGTEVAAERSEASTV